MHENDIAPTKEEAIKRAIEKYQHKIELSQRDIEDYEKRKAEMQELLAEENINHEVSVISKTVFDYMEKSGG